jgi:hypothetical protein
MRRLLSFGALFIGTSILAIGDDGKWTKPDALSTTQMTDVNRIMQSIEERADTFETDFLKGLRSSTVKIEDREKYRVWVDQLEDKLDNMAEAYKEGNIAQAHEELQEAMGAAKNINHFMLNADWGDEGESMWRTIRDDLNRLAKHHHAPTSTLITASR